MGYLRRHFGQFVNILGGLRALTTRKTLVQFVIFQTTPTMPTDSSQIAMRDLGKAKDAFANNDIEASKAAHAAKHIEDHSKVGGFIKSIVFGGLDGQTKP